MCIHKYVNIYILISVYLTDVCICINRVGWVLMCLEGRMSRLDLHTCVYGASDNIGVYMYIYICICIYIY